MAADGTADNPRQIPHFSKERVGFYMSAVAPDTGTAIDVTTLPAFIAVLPKARPLGEPADGDWKPATWNVGAKGARADIEWGPGGDFEPTRGQTYVCYGKATNDPDEPGRPFAWIAST